MSDLVPLLNPVVVRVLGTLIEKQRTVPDTYPMSLNALAAGCNQKTSRHPVMEVSEAGLLNALETLKEQGLVTEVSGGRVLRFAHTFDKALALPAQSVALLAVLMLRGPQTAGELRLNCERLHKFADISSVDAFLAELAGRPQGVLVMEMPRQPGARENRWTHLLAGTPDIALMPTAAPSVADDALSVLSARVAQLEAEMAELRQMLSR